MNVTRGIYSIISKSLFNTTTSAVQQHCNVPASLLKLNHLAKFCAMAVEAPVKYDYGTFLVELVPALQDNYMYVVIDKASNIAAVVDPVEPQKVLDVVAAHKAELKYVWTTHHHWDHAGGNEKLKEKMPHVEVYGGGTNVPAHTRIIKDNEEFTLGNDTLITAIATPCHTRTSICYHVHNNDSSADIVFTGDTLFIAGAGKFFEGNGTDMHNNLNVKLAKLDVDCNVFCGHEYTVSNLQFAQSMEPNNTQIVEKISWARTKRSKMEPTVPSTIGEELATNPFMRIMTEPYRALADKCGGDMNQVMDLVREKKNNFKAS